MKNYILVLLNLLHTINIFAILLSYKLRRAARERREPTRIINFRNTLHLLTQYQYTLMGKKIVLFFNFLIISTLLSITTSAQTKAITEKGDEVILYNNHTWKFTDNIKQEESIIKSSGASFTKNKESTFLLKSSRVHMGFWLDPRVWTFGKATSNLSAEYELQQKDASIQAVIIPEKAYIPLENLRDIAITNARVASPDYEVEHTEYRMVNGLKILYIQSKGTISGIKFAFYGYYFTDSVTTIQFIAMGYEANRKNDQKIAENLLNGLVVVKPNSNGDKTDAGSVATVSPDSVAQGAFSVNHNCKRFFEGKWRYTAVNQKVYVERTFAKTTEYIGKYTFEYDNKWLNDCEYEMTFTHTTMPDYILEKPGEKMHISIMNIDKNVMRYIATFKGRDVDGEMERQVVSNK